MAIEFIGHKQNLLVFIVDAIQREARGLPREVADLFCGTATVSRRFKGLGYRVIASDNLVFCSTFAKAALLVNSEPDFAGVVDQLGDASAPLLQPSAYDRVIAYLDGLPGYPGFIHRHYSPASSQHGDVERMYFTSRNAARIDAIRRQIHQWAPLLSDGEHALLLCDLIRASNSVSNIAGTYGCYLKYWKTRAKRRLRLQRDGVTPGLPGHEVFCEDANSLVERIEAPIVYADPPYTKRQYSAYYHILETIALGDEPSISGKTGLRSWREKASDYCYRDKAPGALADLVAKLRSRLFFLSYSADGQIPHDTIIDILSSRGTVHTHTARYRRYRSTAVSRRGNHVEERLYVLRINR